MVQTIEVFDEFGGACRGESSGYASMPRYTQRVVDRRESPLTESWLVAMGRLKPDESAVVSEYFYESDL